MISTLRNARRNAHLDPQNPLYAARQKAEEERQKGGVDTNIVDARLVREFMFAGNARISLESLKTGRYVHLRIKQKVTGTVKAGDQERHDIWFVAIDNGDASLDLWNAGYITKGREGTKWEGKYFFNLGKKVKWIDGNDPRVKAVKYLLTAIGREEMPRGVNVLRGNTCGRCNRELKVPNSIEGNKAQEQCRFLNEKHGIGPICRGYMGIK